MDIDNSISFKVNKLREELVSELYNYPGKVCNSHFLLRNLEILAGDEKFFLWKYLQCEDNAKITIEDRKVYVDIKCTDSQRRCFEVGTIQVLHLQIGVTEGYDEETLEVIEKVFFRALTIIVFCVWLYLS